MDHLGADGKVIPGGTCIDARAFILTSCVLSIFMDLIIIPIPSIMVWNLKMARKTKVLVVVIMSLGWMYVTHFPYPHYLLISRSEC
jgi:structural maintenance of chromosome 2